MKELAIIGPTASGKTDAAIALAQQVDAYILSIDSLSIYKEIDIASAKPSLEERLHVRHFGIDVLMPNEHFSVTLLMKLYHSARQTSLDDGKHLIIVGGSSFYLKSLINGLSYVPEISPQSEEKAQQMLSDLHHAYAYLYDLDPEYMSLIDTQDRYRIEKMLQLHFETQTTPSKWFAAHPPKPVVSSLPIYNIDIARSTLRERIATRSKKMLQMGLIDEICMLEHRYTRAPNSMKAIGIVEVLEYLDGLTCKAKMLENIITHTAQLAKRQQTFNNNQFDGTIHTSADMLVARALKHF